MKIQWPLEQYVHRRRESGRSADGILEHPPPAFARLAADPGVLRRSSDTTSGVGVISGSEGALVSATEGNTHANV